jgi:hypothetical protein
VETLLKTETRIVATDYDFEAIRELQVYCDCGAVVPDEPLFTNGVYVCRCGKTAKLAELDALADAMIQPLPC